MSKIKSDIEIARTSKMKPIGDVLGKFNIPDDPFSFSPMGRHIAKLNLEYISTTLMLDRIKYKTKISDNVLEVPDTVVK